MKGRTAASNVCGYVGCLLTFIVPALIGWGTSSTVAAASDAAPVTIGVYIPGAAQHVALLEAFEATTGHRPDIVHWYQPWGYSNGDYTSALDTAALQAVVARGATPLITWEAWGSINGVDPAHVANIPTGAFDGYIDSWAQGLKGFGKPVYLRLFHEMNYQGYPWAYGANGNTADDLVNAWRYVHDRFAHVGATNVRWVWSPNPDNGLVAYSAIYPGDGYVDWFGLDVYNGGTQFDWGGWQTAQQIAGHSYQLLQAINPRLPIMLAETSSVEQGGSKAQWITDLFRSTPTALPNLRAIVWFDADWETQDARNLPIADWRIDTSPAALQAYRNLWEPPPNSLPPAKPAPPAPAAGQPAASLPGTRAVTDTPIGPPAPLPPSR